jgi:hypothetical protein
MTLDEEDTVTAAVNRLYLSLVSLGGGNTSGRDFQGALWVISDVADILEKLLEKAGEKRHKICAGAT